MSRNGPGREGEVGKSREWGKGRACGWSRWYTERNRKKQFCRRTLVEAVCAKITSRTSYIIFWGPVQNRNAGPLVQKLRLSGW